MANIFVFAHINYATHVQSRDGDFEIINLDSNFYYRFINVVSFGGYFHKNHHLKPYAFNPKFAALSASSGIMAGRSVS
jgi:hypothetical protein